MEGRRNPMTCLCKWKRRGCAISIGSGKNASRGARHRYFIKGTLALVFMLTLSKADYLQDDSVDAIEITRICATSIPVMKNDSLLFYLDLIFKDFPAKFWSYSDSANHTATIEILGREVRAPAIKLPSSNPISKMQIKNRSTKMALSGLLAVITFNFKPGWNIEIMELDSNDIRLTAGKKMEIKEIKEQLVKKRR
jgi:hypothetical protein